MSYFRSTKNDTKIWKAIVFLNCALILVGCGGDPASGENNKNATTLPAFCSEYPRPGWANYEKHAVSDDWFEVFLLEEGLFAIAEPFQWQEVISYLIIGDDRALLFDTGNGMGDIKATVDQLTNLPVTVLASHSHIDHVGGHWQFDDVLAPDTSFTNSRAPGKGNDFVREEASASALCAPLPNGVTEYNHHIKPFTPTARVKEGTKIDIGGSVLEVLMTPGHTPDSIVLLDRARGWLFSGDTYYKGPIWLFSSETDYAEYGRSIARLAALAPSLSAVYGGHNEPYSDPGELVKVRDGFEAAQAGEIEASEISNGQAIYEFGTFGLVMQAPAENK